MTVKSWREVDLGEVVEFLDYKRRPLNSRERAERKGSYPYYGASGPFDGVDDYLFDGRYLLVAEDGENLNSRKLPVAFFATGKFWVNNHAHIIRGLPGLADDDFLKHWFAGNNISGYITGAAQPKLSQASMKRIRLLLPTYEAQRRITSILSAYDDLIENNTRRIAILEEIARRIYEEWFVRFRFPGHEGVRMVESELGFVPEDWTITTLGRLVQVNARSVRRGTEPAEIRYVDISSVSTGSMDKKESMLFTQAPGRARRIVQHGDVIWACVRPNRKSYSLVLDPEPNLLVSTGFAVLSPVGAPWSFVYQCVTTDNFVSYLVNHAKGAAYPAVSAGDFENAKVLKPTDDIVQAYDRMAEPMMRLVAALQLKNANLRTTRDLLLPKLISGELDVSALPEPETLAA